MGPSTHARRNVQSPARPYAPALRRQSRRKRNNLRHTDVKCEDEMMSPALHNTNIFHWLQALQPDLCNLDILRVSTTWVHCCSHIPRHIEGCQLLVLGAVAGAHVHRVSNNLAHLATVRVYLTGIRSLGSEGQPSCGSSRAMGRRLTTPIVLRTDCLLIRRECAANNPWRSWKNDST